MLMLKLHYRFALVAAILGLVSLGFFLKTNAHFNFPLALGQNPKAWIYSGPEAEDKAVIMAKIQGDDVSWVFEHLPEYVPSVSLLSRLQR